MNNQKSRCVRHVSYYIALLSLVMTVLYVHTTVCNKVANKMVRIDADLKQQMDDPYRMQLGTITFYFEKEPLVNHLPSREHTNSMVFFFPQATIEKDVYASLTRILDAQKGDYFTIRCESVKKPIAGVKLAIDYDVQKVVVDTATTRSLDLKPGLIFSFYNKELLNKINNQARGVLHISCTDISVHRFLFLG